MRQSLCTLFYVILHTDNFSIQEKSSWNYRWLKISEFQIFFNITKFRYQFQNQPTNSLAFFFANAGKVGMSNKAIFTPFSCKAPCLLDLQATQTIAKNLTGMEKKEYGFASDND